MLVVPFAADQFDNGARVERHGFGLCLWRERYNAARARTLLGAVLRDPRFERRTLAAQRQVLSEDGVSRACALLEKAASGSTATPAGAS